MSTLSQVVIARKPVAEKKESDKTTIHLPTVKANLVLGLDKGGEYGVMIPWSRLSKADGSITNLAQYLGAMAKDLAELARKQGA